MPASEMMTVLNGRGDLLARYDRDCPLHGYEVIEERDLPREEFEERHKRGEFDHIRRARRVR